jgi:hypothetical protein
VSTAPALRALLGLFAPLFSNRWIERQTPTALGQKAARCFYNRIYSLRVTLWYLIYQRLNFDSTMAAVVHDLRRGGADRLGQGGKKLSARVASTSTSAYNQARQRLPLALLVGALSHLASHLYKKVGYATGRVAPSPAQRSRQLLDGSTISFLATPALATQYAPARNQKGVSDWCLMRIVVGFCARSGAVLSAIHGTMRQSEQALAWQLMALAPAYTLWIGERNFGVWSVVAKARHHQQDVLVRLTQSRARKRCAGQPLKSGEERLIRWSPSRQDQGPEGLARTAVAGRLIYVRLHKQGRWIDLWLFTTLPAEAYPLELLVRWYGQRWQAELHFRSVKTQLRMAELDVTTPEMAGKEFYAGLVAYSLVRAVMWSAGERLEEGIKTISFSQARRVLQSRLQDWARGLVSAPLKWAEEMVAEVARWSLPKRRKVRPAEMRRMRYRRQKFPPFSGPRQQARARFLEPKSL